MKRLNVKTTDCSCDRLLVIAKKLGFVNVGGRKHCKIESVDGQFITLIPRHSHLAKPTVKGILERFNQFGGNITII